MTVKEAVDQNLDRLLDDLLRIGDGAGPLLQRDYWAAILNSRLTPPQLSELLARDFCSFAPDELVHFNRSGNPEEGLQVGDDLDVEIRMTGRSRVRVLHRDANSLTLGTLRGHPEAGRITFGSYRNREGHVIFHIRSLARSSSAAKYAGFVAAGEPMQTNTWTDFIDRLAHAVGDGVAGVIHAEKVEIENDGKQESPDQACSPTFKAVGE